MPRRVLYFVSIHASWVRVGACAAASTLFWGDKLAPALRSAPCASPRLLRAHVRRMLIGTCNPMLCPIRFFNFSGTVQFDHRLHRVLAGVGGAAFAAMCGHLRRHLGPFLPHLFRSLHPSTLVWLLPVPPAYRMQQYRMRQMKMLIAIHRCYGWLLWVVAMGGC